MVRPKAGPHSLPQPVPGEDQAAGCSTAQPWQTLASATTEVLKRRLAATSRPGDLILFKAILEQNTVKKTTGFPASWMWWLTACVRLGAERRAMAALGTEGLEEVTGEVTADW